MEIRPDKKLITKQWLVLFTITVVILLTAVLLQVLIPLGEATPGQVAVILWPITVGCILLMWIVLVPIVILWIKNLAYHIEEDRITIHKGILSKQQQNIPYRAITDFALHRSLYDRLFGIGSIRIQTAGQSHTATGYEGQLSGLIEWEPLHQELRGRVKRLHPLAEAAPLPGSSTSRAETALLQQIVEELKGIRSELAKR